MAIQSLKKNMTYFNIHYMISTSKWIHEKKTTLKWMQVA